ncbi:UDPGT domain-containing protein, partial [Cephalotus follicularis]
IVLYPSPSIGHLISLVELGKLILKHQPSFSITILTFIAPYNTGSTASYIAAVSATVPSITFHHLPAVALPLTSNSFEDLAFQLPHLLNPSVHQALNTISQSCKLKAFIIDFFNDAAHDVATSLNIPTYYFFTSSGSSLAAFLYLPIIHQITSKNIKDEDVLLHVPGLPPFLASLLPTPFHHRNSMAYNSFINSSLHMSKSCGLIVNTFESLEARPIKAARVGLCVPNGRTPPIFCIGPLIATIDDNPGGEHECISWLNSQPRKSVLFLCFGSMGLFSANQLMEIAIGLERSAHRFLWVVRSPPMDDINKGQSILAQPEPNLHQLLPKGFLERTKDRGLVVKYWAPQVAVLSHDSIGGFVTHCGWNSVLESVCAGVPMIAWPLYAEQNLNQVFVVEEMKIALAIKKSEVGLVSAAELEERVSEMMDSERGKDMRERILGMRDGALLAAKQDGGSSYVDLCKLAD